MSLAQKLTGIKYPESDGKPMGETDLHRDWMVRILELLNRRYRGQRVYVSSDLLVYYVEGQPAKFIVPDDFVVKDCNPGRRRVFKVWEEGRVPSVAFEVTSRKTKRRDQVLKPQIYALIGVPEYFVYDPTAEYLKPPLQGFRLKAGNYERIEPEGTGLVSQELDLLLWLEEGQLLMADRTSGKRLLTDAEAADIRATEAEDELRRLREQLKRFGG